MSPQSLTRRPVFLTLSLIVLTALIAAPLSRADASLSHGYPRPDAAPLAGLPGRSDLPATAGLDNSFGQLPLYFVENRGQGDPRVAYTVLGGSTQVYFTADGVTFAMAGESRGADVDGDRGNDVAVPRQRWAVKLDFVGANPHARPAGEDRTEAVVSYFKGARDQWHAGLPTYARVVYRELWPGIDLAFYGQTGQLKYDFRVHPGADPARIRLRYRGADSVFLNAEGQLEVTTPLGGFTDDAPVAWQGGTGGQTAVKVAYDLRDAGPASSFGFAVGAYDRSQPLVIDPVVLLYCGYIGGSGSEIDDRSGIAVDGDGNAYVAGSTTSAQDSFPVLVGPDQTYKGMEDAFVAKVSASGTELLYAGYIGGSEFDIGYAIAVDGDGNAYVTGYTSSAEDTFPEVGGPDLTHNGGTDAFVAKVSASGESLLYAGYIGGSGTDYGRGIALDGASNAYVTGDTNSTQATFPEAGGPDLTYNGGDTDVFVAKVNASGAVLAYAGYIGGADWEYGRGIAVDGAGNAYVVGYTRSTQDSFPETVGPDLSYNDDGGQFGRDAFVAKVNASGTALAYCGYIGGATTDYGFGIAVDGDGNAYVTGRTYSDQTSFPVKVGPDLVHSGSPDGFVARVSASGLELTYCGYIGGAENDYGFGIAVDGTGNAYVTGGTSSTEDTFPVAGGPDLIYNGGSRDAFVAKVSASGVSLLYAGYIGGAADDSGWGIAVDGAGDAYITGVTGSAEDSFPVTGGPDLIYNGGNTDAFVAKVMLGLDKHIYLPLVLRGS